MKLGPRTAMPGSSGRRGPDELRALGARLADDDETALAECEAVLGPSLRRFLRRRLPADLVDDAAQAVLVDLWRCRHRFDREGSFEAWLFTIARRRAVDQLRARPAPCLPLSQAAERPGADTADRVVRAYDVRRALAALPDVQRQAIEMAYFEDLTQQEIARRLGAPLGTIKARTARGLHRLSDLLAG
ncbi:sigma-70 family RNA polymerase sigma factor [Spirillospora sp. NPDC047279]|uniref:RNA polymerase sigma factor n=1 Tax=Spirillospora sp. NPDC047279 TaxID=3155478 RepID=UPI0033C59003